MKKTNLSAILFIFLLPLGVSAEDISMEKKELLRQFIDVTGAAKIGGLASRVFTQQIRTGLKRSNPDLPDNVMSMVAEEVQAVVQEELVIKKSYYELLYPTYDQHLSEKDVKDFLAFYETPLGKKMLKITPVLAKASMEQSQIWGRSLGPKIQQRLMKRFEVEGIELKNQN